MRIDTQVTDGLECVVLAGGLGSRLRDVVNDVPNFALVAGVPARQIGWVGKLGFPLQKTLDVTVFECPQSNSKYKLADGKLSEI